MIRLPRREAPSAEDFKRMVEPHLDRMALVAARFGPPQDRDDIVQDALLRAWRSRHTYEPSRGPFSGWLFAITANAARTHGRRTREPVVLVSLAPVADLEGRLDIEEAIRRLPTRQRSAVQCYYGVGMSVAETAAVLDCSEGTVKSTLSDARAKLRTLLESNEDRMGHK